MPHALDIETLRAYELKQRNQANLTRWQCQRAWLDHNNEQPRDFRTEAQRERFKKLPRINYVVDIDNEDFFEVRAAGQYFTIDGRAWLDLESRPVKKCGVIDLGDVIFDACPGCGHVIDPKWCWCGDPINSYHEHTPVPMGCECHRTPRSIEQRIAHGLTAGIGDAPGTARVIPDPPWPCMYSEEGRRRVKANLVEALKRGEFRECSCGESNVCDCARSLRDAGDR